MNELNDHRNPFGHPTADKASISRGRGAFAMAATAGLANLALGLTLMAETTRGAWFLLIVMGFVPVAGGAIVLARRLGPRSCACRVSDMAYSLALAGWYLALTLGLKLVEKREIIAEPLADDLGLAMLGAFFVVSGNRLPKILSPLSASKCDPVRTQRVQRFAGWSFVLAGLSIIGIALLASDAIQKTLILLTLGAMMTAVVVRKLTLRPKPRTDRERSGAVMTATQPGN